MRWLQRLQAETRFSQVCRPPRYRGITWSSVRSRGCSGLTYTLEYADEKGKFDEVVQANGVTILIDPKATMFIIGTEMDYVEDKLQSGFTFTNPNEKGRCGCGESFHV